MNSRRVRILVSCCFVAAVGVSVHWMGINCGRTAEKLHLVPKAEAASDEVTDPNGEGPQPDTNYLHSAGFLAREQSRGWEYAELTRNRRHDTNDIEAFWRSKLIKVRDPTEKDL